MTNCVKRSLRRLTSSMNTSNSKNRMLPDPRMLLRPKPLGPKVSRKRRRHRTGRYEVTVSRGLAPVLLPPAPFVQTLWLHEHRYQIFYLLPVHHPQSRLIALGEILFIPLVCTRNLPAGDQSWQQPRCYSVASAAGISISTGLVFISSSL